MPRIKCLPKHKTQKVAIEAKGGIRRHGRAEVLSPRKEDECIFLILRICTVWMWEFVKFKGILVLRIWLNGQMVGSVRFHISWLHVGFSKMLKIDTEKSLHLKTYNRTWVYNITTQQITYRNFHLRIWFQESNLSFSKRLTLSPIYFLVHTIFNGTCHSAVEVWVYFHKRTFTTQQILLQGQTLQFKHLLYILTAHAYIQSRRQCCNSTGLPFHVPLPSYTLSKQPTKSHMRKTCHQPCSFKQFRERSWTTF